MKKFVVFLVPLTVLAIVIYGIVTAPGHLRQVELVVVEKHGNWKDEISQYVVSLVQPGESVSPQLVEELQERLNSLPWVERARVKVTGDRMTVKIWETLPSFYLAFKGSLYLIGRNGFVLEKSRKFEQDLPIYYYNGGSSPFTMEKGFLKLRKTVKMEIKLVNNRIKELTLKGEPPQIILGDSYVSLIFRKGRVIVYLGAEERSWDNYERFVSMAGSLKPGVYDFRFYDMLIRGRKEQ